MPTQEALVTRAAMEHYAHSTMVISISVKSANSLRLLINSVGHARPQKFSEQNNVR